MTIEELQNLPGIGPTTARKLDEAGFSTFQAIAVASPANLSKTADISTRSAEEIVRAARENADIGGFEAGSSVLEKRPSIDKLTTSLSGLDELLGGGIETQAITEFYGPPGSGKTLLAHQLAVNAQLPREYGGLNGSSIYVETRDAFRPELIESSLKSLGQDRYKSLLNQHDLPTDEAREETLEQLCERVLDHIFISDTGNSNEQILAADQSKALVTEKADTELPIRFVCVDTLSTHFRSEYHGRGDLAERQQKLNSYLHTLDKLALRENCAVVLMNGKTSSGDPYGGAVLGHASTVRLKLMKTSGEVRRVKLEASPNLQSGEISFRPTDSGIEEE